MAKYRVKTPNPHFSGVRFGLVFHNGQAETEDDTLALKMKHELGYEVQKLNGKKGTKKEDDASGKNDNAAVTETNGAKAGASEKTGTKAGSTKKSEKSTPQEKR